ncbi:MAG: hypothetical protein K6C94_04810, partial [Candidatus Gastranaerophilales bacterium]|nr:hypothetical protein [Candidatus Gastranaerophilales bacterium]
MISFYVIAKARKSLWQSLSEKNCPIELFTEKISKTKIYKKLLIFFYLYINIISSARGINSAGRVPVLHAGCQEF